MIKIAITDDHPMVISGISNMLSLYEHIRIIGKYGNGEALLAGLEKADPDTMPDVLLLDIQLPDKTGNELMRIISRLYPDLKVLAITSMDTPFHVKDMLKHGCLGYVLKQAEHETLLHAIEEVYAGNQYLEQGMKEALFQTMLQTRKQPAADALTEREKEVLQLIASEYTSQQIAETLFISVKTVESHRLSLTHKLGVKNAAGMIKAAMRMGLVD